MALEAAVEVGREVVAALARRAAQPDLSDEFPERQAVPVALPLPIRPAIGRL